MVHHNISWGKFGNICQITFELEILIWSFKIENINISFKIEKSSNNFNVTLGFLQHYYNISKWVYFKAQQGEISYKLYIYAI